MITELTTKFIGFVLLVLLLCLVAIPIWFCMYLIDEAERVYESDLEVLGELHARPLRKLLNDEHDSRSDV